MSIFSAVGSFFSNLAHKAEDSEIGQKVEHSQLKDMNVYVLLAIGGGLLWLTHGILTDLHIDMIWKIAIVYMTINGVNMAISTICKAWVTAVEAKAFAADGVDDNEKEILIGDPTKSPGPLVVVKQTNS